MSIIVRFEVKSKGALFAGIGPSDVSEEVYNIISHLSMMHDTPFCDIDSNMRPFSEVKAPDVKFAFTPLAFADAKFARYLVALSKHSDEIRMRVITDAKIVWVSASGIQCAFADR